MAKLYGWLGGDAGKRVTRTANSGPIGCILQTETGYIEVTLKADGRYDVTIGRVVSRQQASAVEGFRGQVPT